MAITKPVYVDTEVYRNFECPVNVFAEAATRARKVYANAGIDTNNYALEQKVIIRNYLIKKKNGNKN